MKKTVRTDSEEPEFREVILDRPFIFMIIDKKNKLPIFMGTVLDMEG